MENVSTASMVELLEEVGQSLNDEGGEYLQWLAQGWRMVQYAGPDKFVKVYEKEIKNQYNWIIDNYTQIEDERVVKTTRWVHIDELETEDAD